MLLMQIVMATSRSRSPGPWNRAQPKHSSISILISPASAHSQPQAVLLNPRRTPLKPGSILNGHASEILTLFPHVYIDIHPVRFHRRRP
jgi:hypothetical protein